MEHDGKKKVSFSEKNKKKYSQKIKKQSRSTNSQPPTLEAAPCEKEEIQASPTHLN